MSAPSLVKWIRASSPDPAGFDRAQRRWAPAPGLVAQLGGWSVAVDASPDDASPDDASPDGTRRAVVVALWADDEAHRRFLAGAHDAVADAQRATWTDLAVSLLDVVATAGPGPAPPSSATVLRSAHCTLRPGHRDHALDAQRRVWFPAMADAGMAWGLVAAEGTDDNDTDALLVLTWWPSHAVHDAYRRERVPALRARADVAADMADVTGDVVDLEPGWRIDGAR